MWRFKALGIGALNPHSLLYILVTRKKKNKEFRYTSLGEDELHRSSCISLDLFPFCFWFSFFYPYSSFLMFSFYWFVAMEFYWMMMMLNWEWREVDWVESDERLIENELLLLNGFGEFSSDFEEVKIEVVMIGWWVNVSVFWGCGRWECWIQMIDDPVLGRMIIGGLYRLLVLLGLSKLC